MLILGHNADSFDTIAILIECGAPLDDRNMVFNAGAPNPVIRFKREHIYSDDDSLINMQTLPKRIRNAVAKHIIFGKDEDTSLTAIEIIATSLVKVDATNSGNAPGGDLETLGELMKATSTELTPCPDLLDFPRSRDDADGQTKCRKSYHWWRRRKLEGSWPLEPSRL